MAASFEVVLYRCAQARTLRQQFVPGTPLPNLSKIAPFLLDLLGYTWAMEMDFTQGPSRVAAGVGLALCFHAQGPTLKKQMPTLPHPSCDRTSTVAWVASVIAEAQNAEANMLTNVALNRGTSADDAEYLA